MAIFPTDGVIKFEWVSALKNRCLIVRMRTRYGFNLNDKQFYH